MTEIKTIDELVEHIYADPFFQQYSQSFSNNKLQQEEIFQEYLVKVCEMPEKMIELYNQGSFNYYSVAIIRNMVYNKYSTINKYDTNNNSDEDIKPQEAAEEDASDYQEIENRTVTLLDNINRTVDKAHWYDKELYKMYFIQGMTYRKISELTKIPHTSIFYTIKKMKDRIRQLHGDSYHIIKELRN